MKRSQLIVEDNDDHDGHHHDQNYYKNSSNGYHQYNNCEGLLSWPPKNYTCSFCRREFRSAQALGGHMNVHRRDRAKLRLLPSWIFEPPRFCIPHANANPSFSSSSSTTPHELYPTQKNALPIGLGLSSPYGDSRKKDADKIDVPRTREFKSSTIDEYNAGKCKVTGDLEKKKNKGVSEVINGLDVEMGLNDPKQQVLDLELRLGCLN